MASRISEHIAESLNAIGRNDVKFFSRLVELGEAWRLYETFANRCVYLDIETTGLSPVFNNITVVGLYDGVEYRAFIEGENLDAFPAALAEYDMVVTFNGSQFDLRFLRSTFPSLDVPPIHIDLRWLTRRLGFTGGLKVIEPHFGISRSARVSDLGGFDATVLWSRHRRGEAEALNLLVEYNTQDVVSLRKIMRSSYDRMTALVAGVSQAGTKMPEEIGTIAVAPFANGTARFNSFNSSRHDVPLANDLVLKAQGRCSAKRIIGIDLTGSERRASGWARLDENHATTKLLRTDADIIRETIDAQPDIVSIDSPLSLPGGFRSVSEWRESGLPIYRACELALKRMGISVYWCLLPSMISLTVRGMQIAHELRVAGLEVIESYPGAAQDLMHIPRKGTSVHELAHGLVAAGITGDFTRNKVSHDELDAITSALVGLFFAAGDHMALGNAREDYLIVPRSPRINYRELAKILVASGLDSIPDHRPAIIQCA